MDVRLGGWGGGGVCQKWTNADKGEGGGKKWYFCADVLYGWPLLAINDSKSPEQYEIEAIGCSQTIQTSNISELF